MSFYPPEIRKRSDEPKHAGTIGDASCQGMSASFLCGSFVKISLRIDESSGLIEEAAFTTNGCGFMIAAAESLATWLSGKELSDLHGLREAELLENMSLDLGDFPDARVQCGTVVFEALRSALADHRTRRVEEFGGEQALICTCFGITEETIIDTIENNDVTNVEGVTAICRAGSGCGSCRMLIAELIDSQGELRRGDAETR